MRLVKYTKRYQEPLFELLKKEGSEWKDYYEDQRDDFISVLKESISFIIINKKDVIGFIRLKPDHSFGLFVYDLLVDKAHRGQGLGKKLLNHAAGLYPNMDTYILSDEDAYYLKLGLKKIGSIFVYDK